jgi:hypothetical protein
MTRAVVLTMAAAVVAGVTGCAAAHSNATPARSHVVVPTSGVSIATDLPPTPATWPKYPHFSQHSCWARPFEAGTVHRVEGFAPSYRPAPPAHPTPPAVVVHGLLARLGDRRYVRSIELSPAHPAVGSARRTLYAGGQPPADALQAKIVVPDASANLGRNPTPEQSLQAGIAQFEGDVLGNALRDDLCDAGGAPLVYWASGNGGGGFAEGYRALDERFPNPTPAAFRKRVARVGKRFGFTVASLRLLRPRQIAPLLIVKTQRPRKAFVRDIGQIMELLNPHSFAGHRNALTFEGFFIGAEDAKGPFTFSSSTIRNDESSSGWATSRCLWPDGGMGPVGSTEKPCP